MSFRFCVFAASAAAVAALVTGPSMSADVVIPSSVYSRGAGNAEFRSDVRVFNPTNSPINYTPVLYDQRSGQTITGPLQTIAARAQQSFDNIVGTLFGRTLDDGSFGPIRFQTSGTIVVSSSVNNHNACADGSVSGQLLPGVDTSAAAKAGTLVQLASSVDLNSGYRTNVVFMNPGTQPATVTAKVRKGDGSQLSSATLNPLGANGFIQINNWNLFPEVAGTEDTNLWLEFTSDQPVLSFASVINNKSGDPFAVEPTPEPSAGPLVPVASYTYSPDPMIGQEVTFTDTSTNSPVNRFWSFGDGKYDTSGNSVVVHTYNTANTFTAGLVVSNAAGSSSKLAPVDVSSSTNVPGYP